MVLLQFRFLGYIKCHQVGSRKRWEFCSTKSGPTAAEQAGGCREGWRRCFVPWLWVLQRKACVSLDLIWAAASGSAARGSSGGCSGKECEKLETFQKSKDVQKNKLLFISNGKMNFGIKMGYCLQRGCLALFTCGGSQLCSRCQLQACRCLGLFPGLFCVSFKLSHSSAKRSPAADQSFQTPCRLDWDNEAVWTSREMSGMWAELSAASF